MTELAPLETGTLAPGIRSGFARDINGLDVHVLEAGFEAKGRPLVLLLHGFPECAGHFSPTGPPAPGPGPAGGSPRLACGGSPAWGRRWITPPDRM
jgi:pimeloyl-ACP methyl ester carboxylesterase